MKIDTISFMRGDAFCIFDIFKAIRSYELPLHIHSARMLKRSLQGLEADNFYFGKSISQF